MKSLILALSLAVLCTGLTPTTADAKRIGSGGSSGMQRSVPARTPPAAAPAQPAQATPAPAIPGTAAAAAAPKRSWMGPIAGLAAGLGIAALMSHFGMGGDFGNIIMLVLLAAVAFIAIRFAMNRFARGSMPAPMATPNGLQFAGGAADRATTGSGGGQAFAAPPLMAPVAAASTVTLPAGFDAAAFERVAKLIFIRMQAANDSADLTDLRNFTTPEMFASVKLELQDRGSASQITDVVGVDAQVLEVASEPDRQIVSVRFHGLIREEKDGVAATFDEIWHLVKPTDGSREWAIAGIQQAG